MYICVKNKTEGNTARPNPLLWKYLHNDNRDSDDDDGSSHLQCMCVIFMMGETTAVFSTLESYRCRWTIGFMQLKAGSGHRRLRSDPSPPPSPGQSKLPRLTGSRVAVRRLDPGNQTSPALAVCLYMVPSSVPRFPHP